MALIKSQPSMQKQNEYLKMGREEKSLVDGKKDAFYKKKKGLTLASRLEESFKWYLGHT